MTSLSLRVWMNQNLVLLVMLLIWLTQPRSRLQHNKQHKEVHSKRAQKARI